VVSNGLAPQTVNFLLFAQFDSHIIQNEHFTLNLETWITNRKHSAIKITKNRNNKHFKSFYSGAYEIKRKYAVGILYHSKLIQINQS